MTEALYCTSSECLVELIKATESVIYSGTRHKWPIATPSSEAETACQKWGGSAFISGGLFTVILNRLLVFKCDNLQFWGGLSPPLSKSGEAQAPPAPPRFSASVHGIHPFTSILK